MSSPYLTYLAVYTAVRSGGNVTVPASATEEQLVAAALATGDASRDYDLRRKSAVLNDIKKTLA